VNYLSEAIEKQGLRSNITGGYLVAYVRAIVFAKYHGTDGDQAEVLSRCVLAAYETLLANGCKRGTKANAETLVRNRVVNVLRQVRREKKREEIFESICDVQECALATKHDLLLLQVRGDVLDQIGIRQKCRARKMTLDVLYGKKEISSYSAEDQRIIKQFVWRVLHYVDPDSSP